MRANDRTIALHTAKVHGQRRGIRPEALELVVLPQRRVEDVDNDADEIQQCPATCPDAFGVVCVTTPVLDRLLHAFGERADMGIRRSRGNDEEIGGIADLTEVEHDDVLRLVVIECADGEAKVPDRIALYVSVSSVVANDSPVSSCVESST